MPTEQPIQIRIRLRKAPPTSPTPVLKTHRTTDGDMDVAVAGHIDHLTVQHRRRRGQDVRVVLHHGLVVATFGTPYPQDGQSPGLVWYRTVTGDWEGHSSIPAALRALGDQHLPRRLDTAA